MRTVPAGAMTSPTATSRPGWRTKSPGCSCAPDDDGAPVRRLSRSPRSCRRRRLPAGSGAPVMMRAAWPGPTVSSSGVAGHDGADHLQGDRCARGVVGPHGVAVHGRVGERRDLLGGRRRRALSTQPRASSSGSSTGGSGRHSPRTNRCASSRGIIGTCGAQGPERRECSATTVGRAGTSVHTLQSEPPSQVSRFQIGTVCLRVSMQNCAAANASARCGVDARDDDGDLTYFEPPDPMEERQRGRSPASGPGPRWPRR